MKRKAAESRGNGISKSRENAIENGRMEREIDRENRKTDENEI